MSGKLAVGEIVVGEGVTREIVLGKLRWGNDLFSPTNVVNLKFMNCVKSNNLSLKGVFAKNERGCRLNAIKKRFWSLLILLLSVASIRRKLSNTEERSDHTN